jgi:hypothetical protein
MGDEGAHARKKRESPRTSKAGSTAGARRTAAPSESPGTPASGSGPVMQHAAKNTRSLEAASASWCRVR